MCVERVCIYSEIATAGKNSRKCSWIYPKQNPKKLKEKEKESEEKKKEEEKPKMNFFLAFFLGGGNKHKEENSTALRRLIWR